MIYRPSIVPCYGVSAFDSIAACPTATPDAGEENPRAARSRGRVSVKRRARAVRQHGWHEASLEHAAMRRAKRKVRTGVLLRLGPVKGSLHHVGGALVPKLAVLHDEARDRVAREDATACDRDCWLKGDVEAEVFVELELDLLVVRLQMHMHGTCTAHAWHMHGTCMAYASHTHTRTAYP